MLYMNESYMLSFPAQIPMDNLRKKKKKDIGLVITSCACQELTAKDRQTFYTYSSDKN